MTRSLLLLLLAVPLPQTCLAAVTFDWAHVGNAGNAPDPQTGYGAVPYNYRISKYEVTNAQYSEFLNAVDPMGFNVLQLYNTSMSLSYGGIQLQPANADGSKYIIKAGRGQHPVNYVSFTDAIRFVNWLHNGQGSGSTETGAYAISDGSNVVRSVNARYWMPTEDEWYKAAYHNVSAGTAGVYFDYATGSDDVPASDQPWDNLAAVNYFNNDDAANGFNDGYAVSGSTNAGPAPFTNVGAYTAAASPYGTFDQNGNVLEWNESVDSSSFRGVRGGAWDYVSTTLRADDRLVVSPAIGNDSLGFRIATIPEPTTLALAAMLTGWGVMGRPSPLR